MIAHQQQERLPAHKFTGAKHRVPVTKRRVLLDKPQPPTLAPRGSGIGVLISRTDHHADLIDAGAKYFLDDDPQRSFGVAVPIHQRLQRECPLRFASGSDDSFFDFHGSLRHFKDVCSLTEWLCAVNRVLFNLSIRD